MKPLFEFTFKAWQDAPEPVAEVRIVGDKQSVLAALKGMETLFLDLAKQQEGASLREHPVGEPRE